MTATQTAKLPFRRSFQSLRAADGAGRLTDVLVDGVQSAHAFPCPPGPLRGRNATGVAQTIRQELTALLHAIIDARSFEKAEEALAQLASHPFGQRVAQKVNEQGDRLLFHLLACHQGLVRVAPEWLWRDFRLRPSRGRNHGCTQRLGRAGLLWQTYHNLTPAQKRSERKRKYKHPGQCPLEVAGSPPGEVSYLDALQV